MKKLFTVAILASFFYSIEGHVSGRIQKLTLEELILSSQVIAVGEKTDTIVKKKTIDGVSEYTLVEFKVDKILYPAELKLTHFQISDLDDYMYRIKKKSTEGRGNRIGLFRKYESSALPTSKIIVFLEKAKLPSEGDYQYSIQGGIESIEALPRVEKALFSKSQKQK